MSALRRRNLTFVKLSLAVVSTAACHVGQNPRPEVLDPDSAAQADIRGTMDALQEAFLQGNAAIIPEFFTGNAHLSDPGAGDVDGARGIRDALRAYFGDDGARLVDASIATDILHIDGPDAFEFGTFSRTYGPGEAADSTMHTVRGGYSVHWQRGPEARWRIRRFLVNHLPATDDAGTVAAGDTAAVAGGD